VPGKNQTSAALLWEIGDAPAAQIKSWLFELGYTPKQDYNIPGFCNRTPSYDLWKKYLGVQRVFDAKPAADTLLWNTRCRSLPGAAT